MWKQEPPSLQDCPWGSCSGEGSFARWLRPAGQRGICRGICLYSGPGMGCGPWEGAPKGSLSAVLPSVTKKATRTPRNTLEHKQAKRHVTFPFQSGLRWASWAEHRVVESKHIPHPIWDRKLGLPSQPALSCMNLHFSITCHSVSSSAKWGKTT